MNRPKDGFRKRVYESQWAARRRNDANVGLPSLEACQIAADEITSAKWFTARFGTEVRVQIRLKNGGWSWAKYNGVIELSRRYGMSLDVLTHEIAHIATPWNFAGHGYQFTENLLFITRGVGMLAYADDLETELRSRKVPIGRPQGRASAMRSSHKAIAKRQHGIHLDFTTDATVYTIVDETGETTRGRWTLSEDGGALVYTDVFSTAEPAYVPLANVAYIVDYVY